MNYKILKYSDVTFARKQKIHVLKKTIGCFHVSFCQTGVLDKDMNIIFISLRIIKKYIYIYIHN